MTATRSRTNVRRSLTKLFANSALLGVCVLGASAKADVVFEESFENGLGLFSESGRVYTGSYGVRLRGGASDTQIVSPMMNGSNFSELTLSYDRTTYGLDSGETAEVEISVNGGGFFTVESERSVSGRHTINFAPDTVTIAMRVSLNASSFFEYVQFDNVVLEGRPDNVCEPGDPDCSTCPEPNHPECGNAPIVPITTLMNRAELNGACNVSIERPAGTDSTFYIPRDPGDPNARFHVLVWGNGTGGGASTYQSLLSSVASQCIAVAAANTPNSGSGVEMEAALQALRDRHSDILVPNLRVCTAGHSQGGGGSFNAANRPNVDADCVIPVQPDTRFTVRIEDELDPSVEVITLWSSNDTLAPASGNRGNVESNSTILTQVETAGETHFTPVSGNGGDIGTFFRMASIAQLSNNPSLRVQNRRAFFGPSTTSRISESMLSVSDFVINGPALATTP